MTTLITKDGIIAKIFSSKKNDDMTYKIVYDTENGQESADAYCVGILGWLPGTDDVVRIFKKGNDVCVEPEQFEQELNESEKNERTEQRISAIKGIADEEKKKEKDRKEKAEKEKIDMESMAKMGKQQDELK
jgi:hypothetical protein